MTSLDPILRRLVEDFEVVGLRWALVGGLAVSARAEPRTTRDVDVAVAVDDDAGAEAAVLALRQRGYRDAGQMIEQRATGRLATMRIVSPATANGGAVVDLIFASTGIEREIVAAASPVEVFPGTTIPVASLAHLLAMKVLAGRLQDVADFASLFRHASAHDLVEAREALELIEKRRSHRQKDLVSDFERLCAAARREA
jgi:hypothetical protein